MHPFCTVVWDLAFALFSPPTPNKNAQNTLQNTNCDILGWSRGLQLFKALHLGSRFETDAAYRTAEKFKQEKTKSVCSSIFKTGGVKKGEGKKKKKRKKRKKMFWFCNVLETSLRLRSRSGYTLCLLLKLRAKSQLIWQGQSQSGGIFHTDLPLKSPCSARSEEWQQKSQKPSQCQVGSLSVLNWWILASLVIAGPSVVQHCPSFFPEGNASHWACQDRKALSSKSTLSYPWDSLLYSSREYGKRNELFKNVKYSFWSKDEEELLGWIQNWGMSRDGNGSRGREKRLWTVRFIVLGYRLPEERAEDTLLELLNTRLDKTLEYLERLYSHRFLRLERTTYPNLLHDSYQGICLNVFLFQVQ